MSEKTINPWLKMALELGLAVYNIIFMDVDRRQ